MGAANSPSGAESTDDELHQEPEAAPCHPSSTPLSQQLSLTRGISCNILSPGVHRLQTLTTAGPGNGQHLASVRRGVREQQFEAECMQQSGEFHAGGDVVKPHSVAVVSHGIAIKCLLRGLMGSDPHFTTRWCIDNTSVTVVRHSTRKGWEVQRVNDRSHLRLL